jgi:opacity protein-like surface antigen
MKAQSTRSRLAATAAGLLLASGSAGAADWSGFYAGGSAGYGWGTAKTDMDGLPPGPG